MFRYTERICVFTLAATGLWAQQTTPTPPVPMPATRTSGIIGVAEGQTARLNILNPGVAAPALGVVCSAVLTFYDSDGKAIKSSTVSVTPGTAAFLDLFSDADLALAADERKEIRATVTIPAVAPPPAGTTASAPARGCELIGTLEIFDGLTGRTEAVLGHLHAIPSVIATPAAVR